MLKLPGAGQRRAWVGYKHREVGGTERRKTDYHRTGLSTRAGLRAEVGLGWFAGSKQPPNGPMAR